MKRRNIGRSSDFMPEGEKSLSPALAIPEAYRLSFINNHAYKEGHKDGRAGNLFKDASPPSVKGHNWPIGRLTDEEKEAWLESYVAGVAHGSGQVYSTPRKRGRPKGFKDLKQRKRRTKAEMLAGVPKKNVSILSNPLKENNMSAVRINPRKKGSKDKTPRTRMSIIELRKMGREDKREGLPAMHDSAAYMYGYTGGKSKPKRHAKPAVERRGRPKGSRNKKTIRKIQDEQDFYRYNPIRHYPKTTNRGRPSANNFWILDLYNGKKIITTHIGKGPKEQTEFEAKRFVGSSAKGKTIHSVILSGPYNTRPNKNTVRR